MGTRADALATRVEQGAQVLAAFAEGLSDQAWRTDCDDGRTVVSSFHVPSLVAVARCTGSVRIGFTYPEDRYGVSRRPALQPVLRAGLVSLRATVPVLVPRMIRRAGATALMLQHALVTARTVSRAHAMGAAVLAWTVDDVVDLDRVLAAGVDGVITNDPRIFDSNRT